jgi:hypothetical protein
MNSSCNNAATQPLATHTCARTYTHIQSTARRYDLPSFISCMYVCIPTHSPQDYIRKYTPMNIVSMHRQRLKHMHAYIQAHHVKRAYLTHTSTNTKSSPVLFDYIQNNAPSNKQTNTRTHAQIHTHSQHTGTNKNTKNKKRRTLVLTGQ